VVLWPKHGLPIQPGLDEEEVILGQVVMTDFARAQVLDRLLVHERRIESSLYRTMAELRKEREVRTAANASVEASHSKDNPPPDQEPAAPAEFASFGANPAEEAARVGEVSSDSSDFTLQTSHFELLEEKITPYGVTTNPPAAGVDCHLAIPSFHRSSPVTDVAMEESLCKTNPIPEGRPAWSKEP